MGRDPESAKGGRRRSLRLLQDRVFGPSGVPYVIDDLLGLLGGFARFLVLVAVGLQRALRQASKMVARLFRVLPVQRRVSARPRPSFPGRWFPLLERSELGFRHQPGLFWHGVRRRGRGALSGGRHGLMCLRRLQLVLRRGLPVWQAWAVLRRPLRTGRRAFLPVRLAVSRCGAREIF